MISARHCLFRLSLFFCLIVVLSSCAVAQQKGSPVVSADRQAAQADDKQQTAVDTEKQRAAEEAAERIMRRFYETLDFGTVYRELFVADPAREFEVSLIVDNKVNWERKKKISFAAKERAYVAMINFWWLISSVRFTSTDREKVMAVLEGLNEPYLKLTRSDPETNIQSDADLDEQFTAVLKQMSDVVRKEVKPANFGTEIYNAEVGKVEEAEPDKRQELKELFADVLKGREIYAVRRELHYLYLTEENGEFRLLTYTSRRRH